MKLDEILNISITWQKPTWESPKEYPTNTLRRDSCPSGVSNQGFEGKVRGRSCMVAKENDSE